MAIILCVVLAVFCTILLVYIYFLKRQTRDMTRELQKTRQASYDRQLITMLFDRDINELATEINKNLYFQKALKLEAERSRQQLKQSISDIAHDLRTPLTVVKGNLQMIEKEAMLSDKDREHLRISMEKSDVLREMVDDFFEMSVIESDTEAVELEMLDATTFLAQFLIDNETVIRDRGLTPKLSLPKKSVFIMANEMLMTRMCNNLLNNIFKYAEDEFSVELREIADIPADNHTSLIFVFSNKIPADTTFDINRIFDRAYRGDKSCPTGSAGLGLYIVKLLAKKQGAEVSAWTEDDRLYMQIRFVTVQNRQETVRTAD